MASHPRTRPQPPSSNKRKLFKNDFLDCLILSFLKCHKMRFKCQKMQFYYLEFTYMLYPDFSSFKHVLNDKGEKSESNSFTFT